MKLVGRVGDVCGGNIVTGASSVIVEGKVITFMSLGLPPVQRAYTPKENQSHESGIRQRAVFIK